MRHLLKTLWKPDSQAHVEILQRDNGLFAFEEKTWTVEDNPATWEPEGYWLPTHVSGYYQSAEAAEADARAAIPWLREQESI